MIGAVILFYSLLTACVFEQEQLPTVIPTADLNIPGLEIEEPSNLMDDSPRPAIVSPLPPTWTVEAEPVPTRLLTTPTAAALENGSKPVLYIVQQGDTLGEIALRYNVSIEELAAANDLQDLDQIEEGQELVIP